MGKLVFLFFWVGVIWWIRKDLATRGEKTAGLWIPTIWVAVLGSRPVSMWLGTGGDSSLEGSPVDAAFYLGMLIAVYWTLARRRVNWSSVFRDNKALFAFYGYFLLSVLWAEHPVSSLKRLVKDFGNVAIALVILTDADPRQAIKIVFIECAYVLIPASWLVIRYVPDIGRHYNMHSGELEAIGVTAQKNYLGALILICGLVVIYDMVETWRNKEAPMRRMKLGVQAVVMLLGAQMLRLSDSKTSIVCLTLGAILFVGAGLAVMRRWVKVAANGILVGFVIFAALGQSSDIKAKLLDAIGRDPTMTGRTEVWQALLDLHTNPVIGTGYCSIWDSHYRDLLPNWVAFSAHNGYLETYLDGGWIAVALLIVMLFTAYSRRLRDLDLSDRFTCLRLTAVLITILGAMSESNFARLDLSWFFFILMSLSVPIPPLHRPEETPEREETGAVERAPSMV